MSSFNNNNLIHNIRTAVRMVEGRMPPSVVSAAFKEKGIDMPAELIAAASQPGVLESMGAKPITHAVADNHIDVYGRVFVPFSAKLQNHPNDDEIFEVELQEEDEE